MDWLLAACLASVAASAAALALAAYTQRSLRGLERLVEEVLEAAGSRERIARALARAREKPRDRYIVFEVASAARPRLEDVEEAIIGVARSVLGAAGLVDSRLRLVYYDESSRRGILRVRNTYKYHALAILGLVRRAGGAPVMIIPVSTHGTIKSARKRLRG